MQNADVSALMGPGERERLNDLFISSIQWWTNFS